MNKISTYNKSKIINISLGLTFVFTILLAPVFVSFAEYTSENGVVVKCNTELDANGQFVDPCTFDSVLAAINNVIDFLIYYMVIPIAAIVIMVAGFMYLTSGANPEKRKKARKMLLNLVIGLVLALAAWIIVKFILDGLGYEDSLNIFG
ncbi:MAG: pilin [Candidatus Paceibacterota bacterium]